MRNGSEIILNDMKNLEQSEKSQNNLKIIWNFKTFQNNPKLSDFIR